MGLEEELLARPEIVNPFGLGSRSSDDQFFVEDLNLKRLLSCVPLSYNGGSLAEKVMINLDSNAETVRYRQDALEDLINKPELRKAVSKIISGLEKVHEKLYHFNNVGYYWKGIDLLREYRAFLQNIPNLDCAQSDALLSVRNYFNQIRDSNEFKGLCEFLERIESLSGVDFRVSLNKNGVPKSMSALEIKGKSERLKTSFLERVLGRKKHEETKITDFWGLNELGEQVKSMMSRAFYKIIKQYIPQVTEVCNLLAPLDFYKGFAEYFKQLQKKGFDICRPVLLSKEERRMNVRNARNPLLVEAEKNGHKTIPNDIEYNPERNLFVITGPNNGGKTTYVKTIGLIQLMAQSGLFVPAKFAEVSFVDGIYTHFVAPDDITKGEGRYRNELRRMKEILERATPYSLVILDEPCGGTSYEEGERQSLVLLDGFHKLGAATYFTSHMHSLPREIDKGRYSAGTNLQAECIDNGKKIIYTYKIVPGSSGKSYGNEIAREIGLTPKNIFRKISTKAKKEGYKKLLR